VEVLFSSVIVFRLFFLAGMLFYVGDASVSTPKGKNQCTGLQYHLCRTSDERFEVPMAIFIR
jgi:hypothetical protein